MPHTLVAFHAHPDDEALLTAGTLAKAAAAGHRVVLVVATDGALGLTSDDFRAPELSPSAGKYSAARFVRENAPKPVDPASLAALQEEMIRPVDRLGSVWMLDQFEKMIERDDPPSPSWRDRPPLL